MTTKKSCNTVHRGGAEAKAGIDRAFCAIESRVRIERIQVRGS